MHFLRTFMKLIMENWRNFTKKQVKDTTTAKKTVKNFEDKYRKKRPGRPKKKS